MSRPSSESTVFQAIACPTRRSLLDALWGGELNVSALVAQLDVTQSAVSQQLSVLKSAGLIAERQQGRFRYYRLQAAPLLEVQTWVNRYRALIERQLDALGEVLDEMGDSEAASSPPRKGRKR